MQRIGLRLPVSQQSRKRALGNPIALLDGSLQHNAGTRRRPHPRK
jgi:hypothetical protein